MNKNIVLLGESNIRNNIYKSFINLFSAEKTEKKDNINLASEVNYLEEEISINQIKYNLINLPDFNHRKRKNKIEIEKEKIRNNLIKNPLEK